MAILRYLKKETDLKKAWSHEALEFTPWLAEDENLSALGEIIGINLVLKDTESSIGEFRADIICTEENTDRIVVIENQLEPTNHDHLGKIITYASGKDAKTIIWIVSKARDEHAKAIQWLNSHTDIDFFLIEIELWAIDDNSYAPHFNVIERPIDWGRRPIKQEMNQTEQSLYSFWEYFNEIAPTLSSFMDGKFNTRSPSTRSWYGLKVGRRDVGVDLSIRTKMKSISAGIYISNNKELYETFFAQKEMIEKILGTQDIRWSDTGNKDRSIRIYTPFNIENQQEWNKAVVWLCDNALKMRNIIEAIC